MNDPEALRSRAEREAADWFTRLGRRAVTTQALHEFRDWKQDAVNAAAYAHIEAVWSKAGDLRHDAEIRAAATEALNRPPPRPRVTWWTIPRPAALGLIGVLAVMVAAGLIWMLGHREPSYSTDVGEQRLVVLEDGSRIRLNTDSRIRVRFTRERRDLVLERGEAFFEAAHDAARPFMVQAGGTSVRALGTRFDVRRLDGEVHVTLLEGRVQVRQDDHPMAALLVPNQQLTVTAGGISRPRPADVVASTSWTTGRLTFHDTALAAAVAEVNRYGARKIVLADPRLADAPVSGVFDTGDTDAFVAAVGMLFELKAEPAPGGDIRLVPAPSAASG